VQRAFVFLGVVLAVVIMGWLEQRREISLLRAELKGATSALTADADAIKHVEATTELGPGGVDFASVSCPAGYRILYGSYHSVSPDNAEIFFADTFRQQANLGGRPRQLRQPSHTESRQRHDGSCLHADRSPAVGSRRESSKTAREGSRGRAASRSPLTTCAALADRERTLRDEFGTLAVPGATVDDRSRGQRESPGRLLGERSSSPQAVRPRTGAAPRS
jgi:hypothetical protein